MRVKWIKMWNIEQNIKHSFTVPHLPTNDIFLTLALPYHTE